MNDKKRLIRRRIFAIIMVVTFLVIECYVLFFAKFRYDHEQSKYIAEELSFKLALISASLQSGDKASYMQNLTDYRAILDDFGKNNYVRSREQDLLHRLEEYSSILMDNSELIAQIMELRVAIATISTVSTEAQSGDVDAIKVYDIVQNYTDFRNGLERVDAPEFKDLTEKLFAMSNEVIQVAEKAAVCISICPEATLSEKQQAVETVVAKYKDDIAQLSYSASEKYNPNQLILDLNKYSKL